MTWWAWLLIVLFLSNLLFVLVITFTELRGHWLHR